MGPGPILFLFYSEIPELHRLQKDPDLNLGIHKTSRSNFRSFLWEFFPSCSLDILCVAEDNNSKNNSNVFMAPSMRLCAFTINLVVFPKVIEMRDCVALKAIKDSDPEKTINTRNNSSATTCS